MRRIAFPGSCDHAQSIEFRQRMIRQSIQRGHDPESRRRANDLVGRTRRALQSKAPKDRRAAPGKRNDHGHACRNQTRGPTAKAVSAAPTTAYWLSSLQPAVAYAASTSRQTSTSAVTPVAMLRTSDRVPPRSRSDAPVPRVDGDSKRQDFDRSPRSCRNRFLSHVAASIVSWTLQARRIVPGRCRLRRGSRF